jgi:hypothetical protein
MNRRIKIFLIALLFIGVTGPAWGAGWSDYEPATLSDITSKHASHFSNHKVPKDTVTINIHAGGDPFRSTVFFLGEVRNIQPEHRSLIELWGKSLGMDTTMLAKTYKKEIKVQENRQTYWLPVQEILVPYLKREVKKNGEVMLFMVYIGRTGKTPVILVNEFRAF